jgi:hypothetical protein
MNVLNMEGSDYLSQEKLGIKHFLILELFISNTLYSSVTCHQLALRLYFTSKVLDVFSQKQVSSFSLSVAEIDALADFSQSLEEFEAARIRPILSMSSFILLDFKSDCIVSVPLQFSFIPLLSKPIIN